MKISKWIIYFLTAGLGFAVGIVFSNDFNRIVLHQSVDVRLSNVLDIPPQNYAPTYQTMTNITSDTSALSSVAHEHSVRFRQHLGVNYCATDPSGMLRVDPKTLGFTDMSLDNALDLVSAMNSIRGELRASPPTKFRVINGLSTRDESRLMVVALDPVARTEIVTAPSRKSIVYIMNNSIDCPIRCDFTGSQIILNGGRLPQNACQ